MASRWTALPIVLALLLGTSVLADDPQNEPPSKRRLPEKQTGRLTDRKSAKTSRTLDPKLEQSVLVMVKAHLPEVNLLLDRLRDKEPRQYEAGIRNLARFSRRLQSAQKRGEEAFEIEVQIVKAHSAVDLLVAKLRIRDNEADRKALRAATEEIYRAESARAEYDLAVLKSRLAAVQKQVDQAQQQIVDREAKRSDKVEKSYGSYLKRAGRKPSS